jgi:hypothetical protein
MLNYLLEVHISLAGDPVQCNFQKIISISRRDKVGNEATVEKIGIKPLQEILLKARLEQ